MGTPSHEATAEESLEVDDEVELHFGKRFEHGEQPAKPLFSLKYQGLVHGFAGMDQRGEDFANHPRDMPVCVCTFEAFDGLKAVDDVPERGGFDDEDSCHFDGWGYEPLLPQFGFEMSSLSGYEAGCLQGVVRYGLRFVKGRKCGLGYRTGSVTW